MNTALRRLTMRLFAVSILMCSLGWASIVTVHALAQATDDKAELVRLRDRMEKLQADQSALALALTPQLKMLEVKINALLFAMSGICTIAFGIGTKILFSMFTAYRYRYKTEDECPRREE